MFPKMLVVIGSIFPPKKYGNVRHKQGSNCTRCGFNCVAVNRQDYLLPANFETTTFQLATSDRGFRFKLRKRGFAIRTDEEDSARLLVANLFKQVRRCSL